MKKILELYETENGFVFLKAARSGQTPDNLGKSWIVTDASQLEEVFAEIQADLNATTNVGPR